jgi:hypothetical protein
VIALIGDLLAVAATLLALPQAPAASAPPMAPFRVGERAVYSVRYLFASGSGSMEVAGMDTVRGRNAFHFIFTFSGGALGYSLKDSSQSWMDAADFRSLRFHQDQEERGKPRVTRYEIFPDRAVYSEAGRPEKPSVSEPLDDVSFIYFVRTQKLEVGQKLEYRNYFKPESNPVRLEVVRKERITVPAGTFNTVVVHPIIKAKGIFSESGQALMWISDDSARVIVQIKTKLFLGTTITMQLKSFRASSPSQK